MFERASREKLRFQAAKGYLSTEDLWDLTKVQLNSLAKSLNRELKESEEEDFLEEKSKEDVITKLKFDVVLHILEIKKAEYKELKAEVERKAEKQKLLALIEKKQNQALEELSEDELRKKYEEIG